MIFPGQSTYTPNANKLVGLLYRQFQSNAYPSTLFIALIRPHMEYACEVWNPHLQKDKTKLALKCKTLGTNNIYDYTHYWSSSTIRYTCAYKFTRTREITSVVHGRNAENEPVSRIKNGRLPCARKYGNAIAIFETKPLYEKRQIDSGATRILSPLV